MPIPPDRHHYWASLHPASPELKAIEQFLAQDTTVQDLSCALVALTIPGYSWQQARVENQRVEEPGIFDPLQPSIDFELGSEQEQIELLTHALETRLHVELYPLFDKLFTLLSDITVNRSQIRLQAQHLEKIVLILDAIPGESLGVASHLTWMRNTTHWVLLLLCSNLTQEEAEQLQNNLQLYIQYMDELERPRSRLQLTVALYDIDPNFQMEANLEMGYLTVRYRLASGAKVTEVTLRWDQFESTESVQELIGLSVSYPGLRIIGAIDGPDGKEHFVRPLEEVLEEVRKLFRQSIRRNRNKLGMVRIVKNGNIALRGWAPAWVHFLLDGSTPPLAGSP